MVVAPRRQRLFSGGGLASGACGGSRLWTFGAAAKKCEPRTFQIDLKRASVVCAGRELKSRQMLVPYITLATASGRTCSFERINAPSALKGQISAVIAQAHGASQPLLTERTSQPPLQPLPYRSAAPPPLETHKTETPQELDQ